jgi:hypothetical protein
MMRKISTSFLLSVLMVSCNTYDQSADKLFTLLDPEYTKVDFSNILIDTEEFNIVEYLNYYNGAGVAAGDVNNDGWVDLYFASNQSKNRLFLNEGNFKFRDITNTAGIDCPGMWKTGVSMADINGDGYLDIYVCQVGDYKNVQGENHLYINNGDLTFTERTEEYGLQFKGFSTQSLFFDYDNDGDLDMFLLNHAIHSRGSYGSAAIIRYTRNYKTGDRLYRQIEKDGKPFFVNVTEVAGIFSSRIGYGLGVSAGDINLDGCIDLYISNDFHENDYLYINNCDGTFTEKIRVSMGHTTKSSMGNDMADFNNDGLLDIFSLDMFPAEESIIKRSAGEEMMEVYDMKEELGYYYQLSRNALQMNMGKELFSEIGAFSGVYATDWSWSPLFFDADNDGFKDLFISNGIPRRPNDLDYLQFIEDNTEAINSTGEDRISSLALVEQMPSDTIANYAFRNNTDLTFTNAIEEWGMNQKAFSNCSVYTDLDNDGDLDYVVSNLNENCFIYRNNAEIITDHNYLKIKLNGSSKNKNGIGSRIEVWQNESVMTQQVIPVRGAMSCVDPNPVFGLGEDNMIDSVIVYWPQHKYEIKKNIESNQTIDFDIKDALAVQNYMAKNNPLFKDLTDSIKARIFCKETKSSDFLYQPLLPHKISTLGVKQAIGDVNGDDLADLYFCGTAGQAGQLLLQNETEYFTLDLQESFIQYQEGEDADATFADIDGDQDLDLLIVQGSSEHIAKPELNRALLFKNIGNGKFSMTQSFSGKFSQPTCVAVSDFDRDGDQDIFIGSRPNLLLYGYPGINSLLLNDGQGHFSDVTETIGSALKNIGMITDATWADIDLDMNPELVVAGEWMGIKIFKFSKTGFIDISQKMGLEKTDGWWNCVIANDLDLDGDIDLVAGNLGLNAKINGTSDHPAQLYAKDFDGDGKIDPIICTYRNGLTVPFATRDDLLAQIPSLRNKFSSYKKYSQVKSIENIFSEDQINDALISNVYEFRTAIFENSGNGRFNMIPLAKEAQLFPVFAIEVMDMNEDGLKDILLGGNLYEAHITYGRYDAGYGLFLKGGKNMNFESIPFRESGVILKGEIRDIKFLNTGARSLFVVSKSNGSWQVITPNN